MSGIRAYLTGFDRASLDPTGLADAWLSLCAAHGGTLMLSLLASRWAISIMGQIHAADPGARSLTFNAIAFAAYLAGAAHYGAATDSGWFEDLAGVFFMLNLALILFDSALIIDLRRIAERVPRNLQREKLP